MLAPLPIAVVAGTNTFVSVLDGRPEVSSTCHLSSDFAWQVRHLAYYCHPYLRGWEGRCRLVEIQDCDAVLEELDAFDGAVGVSTSAAEVLAGILRYCPTDGQFYWAANWAVRDPADFTHPRRPDARAQHPVDRHEQLPPGEALGGMPEAGAREGGPDGLGPAHGDAHARALGDRMAGQHSRPLSGDAPWSMGEAKHPGSLAPSGDNNGLSTFRAGYEITWKALLSHAPVSSRLHGPLLESKEGRPSWLLDLNAWFLIRKQPELWRVAQEEEQRWIAAEAPLSADTCHTSHKFSCAEVAERLDSARKRVVRGASMLHNGWPSDVLEGLKVLEKFTPGITTGSNLFDVASEAFRMCRDLLSNALANEVIDIKQVRGATSCLPTNVRQQLMLDWLSNQQPMDV